jgi:hypothetical protein
MTVHFQSWAKWLMALVLKYCFPWLFQQYNDIPCRVVGLPFLSTILFPLTLSLPWTPTNVCCPKLSETRARQAIPIKAIPDNFHSFGLCESIDLILDMQLLLSS